MKHPVGLISTIFDCNDKRPDDWLPGLAVTFVRHWGPAKQFRHITCPSMARLIWYLQYHPGEFTVKPWQTGWSAYETKARQRRHHND